MVLHPHAASSSVCVAKVIDGRISISEQLLGGVGPTELSKTRQTDLKKTPPALLKLAPMRK
jgi:hypothetical protein